MPIIDSSEQSAPVFFPKSDYKIVKYLDLTKFMSLIQNNSLFFCRLDKLEDKFEGTTSKPNREARIKYIQNIAKSNYLDSPLSEEDILKKVDDYYELERSLKSLTCVNCWNKNVNESAALWKIYSSFTNGIMLKSSIEKLKKSFELTVEEIQLSEIKYLDYSSEMMPDSNTNYPVIHKHICYSYEEEIRLIFKKNPKLGFFYDWSIEKIQEGQSLKVDLDIMIDEIIISPYASNWFFELVKDISKNYKLDKPIIKSELTFD